MNFLLRVAHACDSPIKLNGRISFLLIVFLVGMLLFLILPTNDKKSSQNSIIYEASVFEQKYNSTYPLSKHKVDELSSSFYRIAFIADSDSYSKDSNDAGQWHSKLQYAELQISSKWDSASIKLTESFTLSGSLNLGGRGLELSELCVYNGKLYTIDDRTGIVYEISEKKELIPWVILPDGNGRSTKAFKGEWMAIKDEILYIGSSGKPYTHHSSGEHLSNDPLFVKAVSHTGQVQHLDWSRNYEAILTATGIQPPGYLIHEAVGWSQHHKQWFFLPRKESYEAFNIRDDELKGSNLVLRTYENFITTKTTRVGSNKRGFSAFKFVPHTNDLVLLAIKTTQQNSKFTSHAVVFWTNGEIILDEFLLSDQFKYEGVEFV